MVRWTWRRKRRIATVEADWDRASAAARDASEVRHERLAGREAEVAELEVILFQHDPIGINFETNTDEYRSEAETIALRRPEARSAADVRRIVHEEFMHWFGSETAGSEPGYEAIANEIWGRWTAQSDDPSGRS